MSCQDQSLVHQFLYGKESIAEVFGILYAGYVVANFTQRLCKSGTSEFQFVEAEIDMIECCLFVVHQYRRYDFLHVGYFAAGRYDHCSRRNHFLAVRIFLCHGQRVFSGRNIDLQGAAEVAQCFHGSVETSVFTFL